MGCRRQRPGQRARLRQEEGCLRIRKAQGSADEPTGEALQAVGHPGQQPGGAVQGDVQVERGLFKDQ